MKRIKFYLDFDGTITNNDVVDTLLERFADKSWKEIEKEWQEGKIGSRECLTRQLELVRASSDEVRKLCDEITVDPHFLPFLQDVFSLDYPVTILSDGFEFVIRHILERHLAEYPDILKKIPVYANDIRWIDSGPKAVFHSSDICHHGCANCKPEVIKNTAWPDDMIFFVGDGLSDRYAAEISNLTFAKGKLLNYCQENGFNHEPYSNFGDVQKWFFKNHEFLKLNHTIKPRIV